MNEEELVQKKWQLTACKVSKVRSKIKKKRMKLQFYKNYIIYLEIRMCINKKQD